MKHLTLGTLSVLFIIAFLSVVKSVFLEFNLWQFLSSCVYMILFFALASFGNSK